MEKLNILMVSCGLIRPKKEYIKWNYFHTKTMDITAILHRFKTATTHNSIYIYISRAPIDQPFSRESLASLNLVGDRSEHPLSDHVPVRSPGLPPTQSYAVIRNESAPH